MPSKKQIISLSGNSMSPYLKEGDMIEILLNESPVFGNIVLIKDEEELILHRFLPDGLTKGDENKNFDQLQLSKAKIIGVATSRLNGEKPIKIGTTNLNRLISFLSTLNTIEFPLHKVARAFIKFTGNIARWARI